MISVSNEAVETETLEMPDDIVASLIHVFELMEEFGANLGKPHTLPIVDQKGLFEVRAKGRSGIGRSFFCYAKGKKIIILHSFVKKTQKTPQKAINLALKRMKEVDNGKS